MSEQCTCGHMREQHAEEPPYECQAGDCFCEFFIHSAAVRQPIMQASGPWEAKRDGVAQELLEACKAAQGPLCKWANEKGIGVEEWRFRSALVDQIGRAIAKAEGRMK